MDREGRGMNPPVLSLPDLILLADSQGNWGFYEQELFKVFKKDFMDYHPKFEGKYVYYVTKPSLNGKPHTFWHMTTEDKNYHPNGEDDRCQSMRKCERIGWVRPIIENSQSNSQIKIWKEIINRGGKKHRTCIWFDGNTDSYLVVLDETKKYFILWTAYPIEKQLQKDKLQKKFDTYIKTKTATK